MQYCSTSGHYSSPPPRFLFLTLKQSISEIGFCLRLEMQPAHWANIKWSCLSPETGPN
jgi:hypothetical protein